MNTAFDIHIHKSFPQKVLNDLKFTYLSPIDVQQLYFNEPFINYKNNSNKIIYSILLFIIILVILFLI